MSISLASQAASEQAVRAFARGRGEPAFLVERRLKALETYHALPMPGKADELWRRVKLQAAGLDLEAAVERVGAASTALHPNSAAAQGGGFWGSVEDAVRKVPALLEAKWATEVYPAGAKEDLIQRKGGKFHALNQALFDSGYVLHLPKGTRAEAPFRAEFATRSGRAGIFPHNLIVLDEGAEAVVIESYRSGPDDAGFSCPQTEIVLGRGARLRYILLQDLGTDVIHIGAQRMCVHEGAHGIFASAHLGAKLAQDFMECEMLEPHGEAILYGLYYGLGTQQHHLTTYQHHRAGACKSDLLYKGALDHRAQACWRGMIRLEQGAQKTDAYQQNRTLLLSDAAIIHSIPGLEILANDVRCTHGSTAGQIDPTMLFYLLSRGITQFDARKIIMDGFFEEVVLKFGLESVIEPLRALIDRKIEGRHDSAKPTARALES